MLYKSYQQRTNLVHVDMINNHEYFQSYKLKSPIWFINKQYQSNDSKYYNEFKYKVIRTLYYISVEFNKLDCKSYKSAGNDFVKTIITNSVSIVLHCISIYNAQNNMLSQ